MKNQQLYRLLKIKKKNSGFTLLELLTGLVMSGIVIGVLGVGFYQVLKITSEDASKSQARDQASRAIEFITDEIRRAKSIETDATNANGFNVSGATVVLALEIPEISSDQMVDRDTSASTPAGMLGVDNDPSTTERVIYYLKSSTNTGWRGPQVLYRWGPPFNANGEYTQNSWNPPKALIDGIDDTVIASPCPSGTTQTPATAKGFYACLDGTGGVFNTAQIFLTGEVTTVGEDNTNFTSNTQVVARAKEADVVGEKEEVNVQFGVEGLGSDFSCNPNGTPPTTFTMRTDFSQDVNNPTQDKWIYDPDLRGKAFEIDPDLPLSITAIPIGNDDIRNTRNPSNPDPCTNTKFDGKDNVDLAPSASWHDTDGDGPVEAKDLVYTQHIIDFNNPYTFNGNGTLSDGTKYNSPDVRDSDGNINPQVKVLKEGTIVPDVGGFEFDINGNGTIDDGESQPSLGEFLYQKNLADKREATDENGNPVTDENGNPVYEYTINSNLKPDQRIIAFEIGQDYRSDDDNNNGFDLQDNIFVVTSKAFEKQFESGDLE